jgi:GNAT superfamily N-acetyltransferase
VDWRFFEENDLDWILKATKDMFDESEWSDGEYGQKAGFMIGHLGEYRFMNKIYARENEICVLPEYRGSAVAMTMMKKFIEWAKAMKANEVYFEPSTNGKLDKFDAMAKRLGMEISSKTYRKKL